MLSLEEKEIFCGAPNASRGEATHVFADPSGETDRIAFASGRSAVVVSVNNPRDVQVFTEHSSNVAVCKFAPKELIASGDEGGTIRVWNPKTMKQREELGVAGDVIRDVSFTPDMKFMAFATDARNVFAKVVKYPGCGSAGPVSGHTKRVTSVDIRSEPTPAILTGGDDMVVGFFNGPPVKPSEIPKIARHHTNFVLDVRFSPDGTKYASASSDRSIHIMNTETYEPIHVIKGHEGSVSGVAWSKDGTKLLSSSSDKTAKIWDVASGECLKTMKLGDKDFLDMQVGVAWIYKTDELVSVSLRGEISVFDESSETPKKVLRGHNKPIVGLACLGGKVYTNDGAGLCLFTDVTNPENPLHFTGKGHATFGRDIAANSRIVASSETSGNVFLTPTDTLEYPKASIPIKGGCTNIVCPGPDASFAAMVINDSRIFSIEYDGTATEVLTLDRSETGTCLAVSEDGTKVAVALEVRGGAGKIVLYNNNKGKLEKFGDAIQGPAAANRMLFTRDNQTLITGEKSRHVKMFDVEKQEKIPGGGVAHTARVDGISLSPNGELVATVGMDGLLAVWRVRSRDDPVSVKAHRNGAAGVGWVDDETIITGGGDNSLRTWTIKA